MNVQEHLLTILAEECNEVAHRVCKALRFGLDDVQAGQEKTNRERLRDELNDLLGVLEMVSDHGYLDALNTKSDIEARDRKRSKIVKYMQYAGEVGALHGSPP